MWGFLLEGNLKIGCGDWHRRKWNPKLVELKLWPPWKSCGRSEGQDGPCQLPVRSHLLVAIEQKIDFVTVRIGTGWKREGIRPTDRYPRKDAHRKVKPSNLERYIHHQKTELLSPLSNRSIVGKRRSKNRTVASVRPQTQFWSEYL